MKLHSLELEGFGPFRERQRVDFDAFDADGVFLISGRTGAGKSSILDGVSFALFGSVPRYDGGEKRLRSDHCAPDDPSEVVLEFTAGDTRWRVARSPEYERPAKRGGGLTTQAAAVTVEELVDGAWIGRAARSREAGLLIDEVVGLNAQQFQQVILLAQNRFSRFLLARNDERQALLRTLFDTQRFDDIRERLDERRRAAQNARAAAAARADALLDQAERQIAEHALGGEQEPAPDPATADTAARRDAVRAAQARARYRVESTEQLVALAQTAVSAAAARHDETSAFAAAHADLAQARHDLAALEADAARLADRRAQLAAADRAESLRATIDRVDRAAAERDAARRAAEDADEVWRAVAVEGGLADRAADTAGLSALVEELGGELSRWQDAAQREQELDRVTADLAAHDARATTLRSEVAAHDAQLTDLPARRAALAADLELARATAARRDDLVMRAQQVADRLAAAREAETLDADAARHEAVNLQAVTADAAAAAALRDLLARRLAGYAGELAAELAPGVPCAVCGSAEHPHLATPADDPVTEDDVAAAEADRDRAAADARAAAEAFRAVRERAAAAHARAGDATVAQLADEHTAATAEVAAADAAVARVDELAAALAALDAEQTAVAAQRELAASALGDVERTLAAARATAEALRGDVDRARGTYDTVAARIAAVTAQRDAARTCLTAHTRATDAERDAAAARRDLDALVEDAGFDAEPEARAALRDPAVRTAWRDEIDQHAAAIAAVRARALTLEMNVAGDETGPADVEAAAAALVEAEAARDAALRAAENARAVDAGLAALVADVDAAYAGVDAEETQARVVTRLADAIAGRAHNTHRMDLETFVLAAELEEIVQAANLRLAEMSDGRYTLRHSDALAARRAASGLGLEVLDAHTGRARPPHSLSGGETFLASLALALGLAEVVTGRAGGVRLDTLFVDEGFGSLDPDTLELAMRTLDELRAGGRTVGVISHVEAMKEQLPAQVHVRATPEGPSVVRQSLD